MKERPILFSAPMVLALLAGTKTQTRRVLKPQECVEPEAESPGNPFFFHSKLCPGYCDYACSGFEFVFDGSVPEGHVSPYGRAGDRLWVRETTIISPKNWNDGTHCTHTDSEGKRRVVQYLATSPDREAANDYKLKATPSIFMPRWASRITLEVKRVHCERLQEISEVDAVAEGVPRAMAADGSVARSQSWAIGDYRTLWESINGAGSWAANPWVWVVEFRVVT